MEPGFEQPGHHAHWTWRLHDTEQRVLLQALALWERYSEDAHLTMEAHAEQLRALGNLAALVAGFDMVAFAQFEFDVTDIPVTVLLGFGITNALTVALCVLCMTLCMLVQSSIYRSYAALVSEQQQAIYIFQCRDFALRYRLGDRPPLPTATFQRHWDYHCRSAWDQAIYMFTAGVVCFLCNIAFASFIKFDGYLVPAISMSAILGLALLYYLVNSTRWLIYITRAGRSRQAKHEEAHALVKPQGLPFDWCLPHGPTGQHCAVLQSWGPSLPASAWTHMVAQGLNRSRESKWRAEDMQQVALLNARALWARFVERQNDSVEERSEQLRGFSFLSGIVAGFIVSSFLQVTFDPLHTAGWLQLVFGITVGVTAAVTTCSMATCSMVLLSVLKTAGSLVSEREEAAFMAKCHQFATSFQLGDRPPAPRKTFRMHWELRCEHLWYRSFYLFSFGLLSFLINLMFAAWIKFSPTMVAPSATTGILGAALLYLIMVHSRWAKHIFRRRSQAPVQLPSPEPAGLPFDWYLAPARSQIGGLAD